MQITISNVNDGDVFNHSLALIEGEIVAQCVDLENTTVTVSLVCEGSVSPDDVSPIAWPVSAQSGRFKALVELFVGLNHVLVKCKECVQSLKLTYEIPRLHNYVRLLYVVAADDLYDGHFQGPETDQLEGHSGSDPFNITSACARICLGAKLIQTFTAECSQRHGLGRRTFHLETDALTGRPYCHILTLDGATRQLARLPENELWHVVKNELASCRRKTTLSVDDADRIKFLGFVSFTRYRNDDHIWPLDHREMLSLTEGYVALGGGGLALLGTGCLHTWAESLAELIKCFTDGRIIDRFTLLDDSCYRGTYSACYSTTLGATCHELGHTFDLGHTAAGIMARGFDNLRNVFVLPDLLPNDAVTNTPSLGAACNQFSLSSTDEPCLGLLGMNLPNNVIKTADRQYLTESKLCRRFEDWKGAYWCRDSAVWLSYHRWFNIDNPNNSGQGPKIFGCELRSRHGLRVIIATPIGDTNAPSRHWEFLSRHGCLTFRLSYDDFEYEHDKRDSAKPVRVHVRAQDSYGNIMSSILVL